MRGALDERAWDLSEGDPALYAAEFRRARAAASVRMCYADEPLEAGIEAIYEAGHAVGGDPRLAQVVKAAISAHEPDLQTLRNLVETIWTPD